MIKTLVTARLSRIKRTTQAIVIPTTTVVIDTSLGVWVFMVPVAMTVVILEVGVVTWVVV